MKAAHRRRFWSTMTLVLGVAGVFAGATMVSRIFFERPRERVSTLPLRGRAPRQDPAQPQLFRVAAIEGDVETFQGGQWFLVQVGEYLSLQDVLRTPPGTRAILRRGSTEVEVRENVDIRLDTLAAETARFDVLRGGNVSAAVADAKETLEITARQTSTVNQGEARWVVSQGPQGRVNVAASRGAIRFSARGKEVVVREGRESHANDGEPPSEPEVIPEELLLSVFWPELEQPSARNVRGKTRPSTQVRVNGQPVPVRTDGTFAAPVSVERGDTPVRVDAVDILGRRKSDSHVVHREAPPPKLEPTQEELWKK